MRKIQRSHTDQYDRWENTTKITDIMGSSKYFMMESIVINVTRQLHFYVR